MTAPTPSRPDSPDARPPRAEELTCRECGAPGAHEIGDTVLCERCYSEKGSCCPEFGREDAESRACAAISPARSNSSS